MGERTLKCTKLRLGGTRLVAVVALATALLSAACSGDGEDRPQVDVIGGDKTGSASVSVSASGPGPSGGTATTPASGNRYATVSNVDVYFQMALDRRDILAALQPGEGKPADWAKAREIYEKGKNQLRADGTARPLVSIPSDSVHAIFPNGAAVYGRPDFINALIRDGLNGTGRAQGLPDDARRQVVDKGIQMLMYGKSLQELAAARTRVEQKNLDNNTGAPHAVDEAWAAAAGSPDNNGNRPYALLQTARGREGNFKLEGKIAEPLEAAFVAALVASQKGDLAAFDKAHGEIKGLMNTIFYLASLRYVKSLEGATTETQRQVPLVEGWTFFQTIRPLVAQASANAAKAVEDAYNRPANAAFPVSVTTAVYQALNEPAVLQALGIPAALQVKTPPTG